MWHNMTFRGHEKASRSLDEDGEDDDGLRKRCFSKIDYYIMKIIKGNVSFSDDLYGSTRKK